MSAMTPFFSIIIPVYNVAPYLRECLDSVLAQTFGDWEAICVDDGSTDGSGAILDEYAAKDSRFKVIHQTNAGVSAARNAALELMRGEYFTFLDGDDSLLSDALMKLNKVVASIQFDGVFIRQTPAEEVLSPKRVPIRIAFLTGDDASFGYPFCRVYRRVVFQDVRFRVGVRYREDLCYWVDALTRDARWGISTFEYYKYRHRSDSASSTVRPADYADLIGCHAYVIERMRKYLDATSEDVRQYVKHSSRDFSGIIHGLFVQWSALTGEQKQTMVGLIEKMRDVAGYNPYNGWVTGYLCVKDFPMVLWTLCFVHRVYDGLKRRLWRW